MCYKMLKYLIAIFLGYAYLVGDVYEETARNWSIVAQEREKTELVEKLDALGFRFPQVVASQMKLETGNLTSDIYKNANNLFGMKKSWKRKGYASSVYKGHAKYKDIRYSLMDYLEWQSIYLPYYERLKGRVIYTNEEYTEFLVWAKYAEDPAYPTKLKNLMREW